MNKTTKLGIIPYTCTRMRKVVSAVFSIIFEQTDDKEIRVIKKCRKFDEIILPLRQFPFIEAALALSDLREIFSPP